MQTGTKVIGKITTYQVQAKPGDVLDFYKRVMPQDGWPTPTVLEGKLNFIYVYNGRLIKKLSPYELLLVTIDVKDAGSGVTSVELKTGP